MPRVVNLLVMIRTCVSPDEADMVVTSMLGTSELTDDSGRIMRSHAEDGVNSTPLTEKPRFQLGLVSSWCE